MKVGIIGYTGFVGGYLATRVSGDLYNSSNIHDIIGKHYDIVYCCGLPAAKWIANREPEVDYTNMMNLMDTLSKATIGTFILISTIDVYDKSVPAQDEDGNAYARECSYGRHRRLMELWALDAYKDCYIFRLPALFGIGLKKNVIYDLLTENPYCKFNTEDTYQWYYLDDLYNDILDSIMQNRRIVNLFTEPIPMKTLIQYVFPDFAREDAVESVSAVAYNYVTKYGGYVQDTSYIIKRMQEFVRLWKCLETHRDQLVISNLAWREEDLALAVMRRYKLKNLELAVTKYMDWSNDMRVIKDRFEGYNIYSMQALFFGVTCNLFDNPRVFINHFKRVIDVAVQLGVRVLVFGSPKVRYIPNGYTYQEAEHIFVFVMKTIVQYLPSSITLCLEPNAVQYGCNFMNTVEQVCHVLDLFDIRNIKLNLDTGNAIMSQDAYTFTDIIDRVGHVHISAPFLKDISDVSLAHEFSGYEGKISLEAIDLDIDAFERSIRRALALF